VPNGTSATSSAPNVVMYVPIPLLHSPLLTSLTALQLSNTLCRERRLRMVSPMPLPTHCSPLPGLQGARLGRRSYHRNRWPMARALLCLPRMRRWLRARGKVLRARGRAETYRQGAYYRGPGAAGYLRAMRRNPPQGVGDVLISVHLSLHAAL
jgi:hypothetical protein